MDGLGLGFMVKKRTEMFCNTALFQHSHNVYKMSHILYRIFSPPQVTQMIAALFSWLKNFVQININGDNFWHSGVKCQV